MESYCRVCSDTIKRTTSSLFCLLYERWCPHVNAPINCAPETVQKQLFFIIISNLSDPLTFLGLFMIMIMTMIRFITSGGICQDIGRRAPTSAIYVVVRNLVRFLPWSKRLFLNSEWRRRGAESWKIRSWWNSVKKPGLFLQQRRESEEAI